MKKTKALTLILAFLMLVPALAACGGNTPAGGETGTAAPQTTAAPVETTAAPSSLEVRQATKDSLPDGLDFKGATASVLARNAEPFSYEFGVAEMTGEAVNDAIYDRNRTVEERLNLKIRNDAVADGNAQQSIRTAVLSGDDVYALVSGTSFHCPALALEDALVNLRKVKYLDFEQPWWVGGLLDAAELYGQVYAMAGDFALSVYQLQSAMFVNKNLYDSNNLNVDLYAAVREGKWTLDLLDELTATVSVDLNGDGKMTEVDRFGFAIMDSARLWSFAYSADCPPTVKDANGIPQISIVTERSVNVYDKMHKIYWRNSTLGKNKDTLTIENRGDGNTMVVAPGYFAEDHIVFYPGGLGDAEQFREMQSDFMILPYPKYDEAQKDYISYSRDTFTVVMVPVTCKNTDLSGALAEALAAESYRSVTPAYLDRVLKNKYSRDAETAEMVDLITGSVVFNWGMIHSYSIGYFHQKFQNAIFNDKPLASYYAETQTSIEASYKTVLEYYEKHKS